MVGHSIRELAPEVRERFLRNAKGPRATEIRDSMDEPRVSLREIGGAQLKVIECARKLERQGLIKTKRIPV